MNGWIKVGLWVSAGAVLIAVAFVTAWKLLPDNKLLNTTPVVLKKGEEKGQVLIGKVIKYDISSLTVATDGGNEMYFSGLDRVSVWKIKDGKPQGSDWSKVAVGQKVSLSMDKQGQNLVSIIIL